jgi:hypothetical protein
MLADLVSGADELLAIEDPLEPELLAAMLLGVGDAAGEGFDDALTEGVVPELAATGRPGALAMLLAIDAVREVPVAAAAARQLMTAGVPAPLWAAEVREPLRPGLLRAYRAEGVASMLVCSFERAGRTHVFLLQVDHTDCHAAIGLLLFPGEVLDQMLADLVRTAKRDRIDLVVEELTPEDFRWEAERALAARAVHDQETGGPLPGDDDDEDGPDYGTVAELLRSRLRLLPEPARPPAPHGDGGFELSLLESMSQLSEMAEQYQRRRLARAGQLKLPPKPKRRKSDGPAPIFQIKVSLQGAKPPIWRRLEVPADTGLARLHRMIQIAFDWDDSHLHVFRTPYGEFGSADRELGHRAEGPVILEQVAPGPGEKFKYVYDFGDDWVHEIVVEKVLDRQPVSYPRCTGGRRAAPAEDCGGIWGYQELVQVLADPGHPEHQERLEWLGLESAADFQPARFDPAEVSRALAELR